VSQAAFFVRSSLVTLSSRFLFDERMRLSVRPVSTFSWGHYKTLYTYDSSIRQSYQRNPSNVGGSSAQRLSGGLIYRAWKRPFRKHRVMPTQHERYSNSLFLHKPLHLPPILTCQC